MSYVLVTPLKNEEEYVLKLKETVFNQSLRPVYWVIVDSGSEDNTFNLSRQISTDFDWIHVIKQKKFFEKGYGHLNFSEAVNEGYNKAKELCEERRINYEFVAKLDATPIICKDYFKVLHYEMVKDKKLVITCGISKFSYKEEEIDIKPLQRFTLTGFNDIRLYKKNFFENMNGYPLIPSPDSALLIKAVNRDFRVKVIEKVYFKEPRLSGSKVGVWNGSILKGKSMYSLGYHPILAFLNAITISFKMPPHYQFLAMSLGYFISALKRDKQISDQEIRKYYRSVRLKGLIRSLMGGKFV